MRPTEHSTLRETLRARPMAVGILEKHAGYGIWKRLDDSLASLCGSPADAAHLMRSLAELPAAAERSGWQEQPLHHLVDHLTANHAEFRMRDLPNIQRLLELIKLEFTMNHASIEAIIAEFSEFRRDFNWHMDEEEEFLFPKILRTEAGLRHPELYPEAFKGSVTMFSQSQLHNPEATFNAIVGQLEERLRHLISNLHQVPITREVMTSMQGYAARLKAHTYLESEILFPRAAEMEREILRRNLAEGAVL